VAIRTRTILEVKQLKQKAENVSGPVSPVMQPIPPNNNPPVPNIDDLDNLISLETTGSLSQGGDNSALSASNMTIQSISSQSTDTSADYVSSPTDFMTLSPQLESLADSDMTSLFEDLSVPYMQSESQIKLEDLADTLLDQPDTSIDFLEDMTFVEEKSPVVEEKSISPGIQM
jgi:hypothetical protein